MAAGCAGRRDVHKEVDAAGSVSQPDLRRPQLACEFGLGEEFCGGRSGSSEDLETDVARGDLAQGQHRGLVVLPVQGGLGATGRLRGAPRRHQHQLEQVGNVLQAILDGNTGH